MTEDYEIYISSRDELKRVKTRGLHSLDHEELCAAYETAEQRDAALSFINFMVSYLEQGERKLQDGETFAYGSWMTKLRRDDPVEGYLNVWDLLLDGTEYVDHLSASLELWKFQNEICTDYESAFVPPRIDQKVAISQMPDDEPTPDLEAVRYEAPEHMSGWYITSDAYSGEIEDLEVIPVGELGERAPSLLCYLALEPGYRFIREDGVTYVWFDDDVASSKG